MPTAPSSAANDTRARRAVSVSTRVAATLLLALACQATNAGSATANLPVTATVQSACSASADPVAFATYTAGGGPVTSSATITVKCTSSLAFKIALGPGATPGGSIGQRLLSLTVFAELPDSVVNRLATSGIYSDLVTVTITY